MLVSTVVLFFVYRISVLLFRSRCNSVHTVTRLRTELFGVRIWERARRSLLYQNMQTDSGAHPTSWAMGIGGSFPEGKAAEARGWTISCIVDVKNGWCYSSIPPICLHGVCRKNFTNMWSYSMVMYNLYVKLVWTVGIEKRFFHWCKYTKEIYLSN